MKREQEEGLLPHLPVADTDANRISLFIAEVCHAPAHACSCIVSGSIVFRAYNCRLSWPPGYTVCSMGQARLLLRVELLILQTL